VVVSAGGQSGTSQAPSSLEVIEAVLVAMGDVHSSATVQVAGCRALNDMAKLSSTWRSEIVGSGGIEIIIQAMLTHQTTVQVVERGCQVMATMSEHEQLARERCVASGATPVIVSAIRGACKRGRKGGMRVACLALANLASSGETVVSVIVEADGVVAILETMQKHSGNCTMLEPCTLALTQIGQVDVGLSAVRNGGGLAVVREAIELGVNVDPGFVKSLEGSSSHVACTS